MAHIYHWIHHVPKQLHHPQVGKLSPGGVCSETPETAAVRGAEKCSIPASRQGETMHMLPISFRAIVGQLVFDVLN